MFLGRYQLGQSVPLSVQARDGDGTPGLPTDAVGVQVLSAAGTSVAARRMPLIDRDGVTAYFVLELFLDSSFAAGIYSVRYSWTTDSYGGVEVDSFEIVAGGHADGAVIAQEWYPRPHGNFVVQQLDSGKLVKGRNPNTASPPAAQSGSLATDRYRG